MTNGLCAESSRTPSATTARPRVSERRLGALDAQLVQAGPGSTFGAASDSVRFAVADTATRLTCAGFPRSIDVPPGELAVVPAGRSCRWDFTGLTRLSVLSVPGDRLDRPAGTEPGADPLVLPQTVLNRAAAGFLEQLIVDLSTGCGIIDDGVEQIAVDLVCSVLEPGHGGTPGSCPASLHASVLALIDRDFADPALSPGAIAAALAMSRRQLYRYYEDNQTSVSEMIAARRLAHARTLLATRPLLGLSSVAAESGFTSAGTLRRRFVTRYGTTPSEYRAAIYAADSAGEAVSAPVRPVPSRPVSNAFEAI